MKFYNPAHHRVITVKGWKFTMRRIISMLLCMGAAAVMTGCSASAEQHSGQAQGYGGVLRVSVEMDGADITRVTVQEHHETEGVGTRAIEALPDQIVQADSVEVDDVSGATRTSQAIKEAVRQAIGSPAETSMPRLQEDGGLLTGVGMAATGREGPGTDADGNQVYSFNVVFAGGRFDQEGRIVSIAVDQLEVLSSQFSGFPGDEEAAADFLQGVAAWESKGAKGERYMLGSASWREQMDVYQEWMKGKTVAEITSDFSTLFDPETGRPLNAENAMPGTDENAMTALTDSLSGATMSLRGEHGDILLAVQRAWEDALRSQDNNLPGGTRVDTNTDLDAADSEESMG